MPDKMEEVSIVIPREDIKSLKAKFNRDGFSFEEGMQHILRDYIKENNLEELYGNKKSPR